MYLLLRWILNTLILMLVSYLTPGISIASFWTALIASAIFGLINAVIRPIILILTLPINVLTLGLLTFIINALMFWLLSAIVKGFDVQSFSKSHKANEPVSFSINGIILLSILLFNIIISIFLHFFTFNLCNIT
jgi:putative membrane protein